MNNLDITIPYTQENEELLLGPGKLQLTNVNKGRVDIRWLNKENAEYIKKINDTILEIGPKYGARHMKMFKQSKDKPRSMYILTPIDLKKFFVKYLKLIFTTHLHRLGIRITNPDVLSFKEYYLLWVSLDEFYVGDKDFGRDMSKFILFVKEKEGNVTSLLDNISHEHKFFKDFLKACSLPSATEVNYVKADIKFVAEILLVRGRKAQYFKSISKRSNILDTTYGQLLYRTSSLPFLTSWGTVMFLAYNERGKYDLTDLLSLLKMPVPKLITKFYKAKLRDKYFYILLHILFCSVNECLAEKREANWVEKSLDLYKKRVEEFMSRFKLIKSKKFKTTVQKIHKTYMVTLKKEVSNHPCVSF